MSYAEAAQRKAAKKLKKIRKSVYGYYASLPNLVNVPIDSGLTYRGAKIFWDNYVPAQNS